MKIFIITPEIRKERNGKRKKKDEREKKMIFISFFYAIQYSTKNTQKKVSESEKSFRLTFSQILKEKYTQKKLQSYDNDDDGRKEREQKKKIFRDLHGKSYMSISGENLLNFLMKKKFFFLLTQMQSVMNSHNDDPVGWKIKIAKMGSDRMLWQAGAVYRKTLCCNFLCVKAQTECFFLSFSHRPLPELFFSFSALILSHEQKISLALRNFLICVINWIFYFSTDVLAIHLNSPIFQAFFSRSLSYSLSSSF